MEARHGPLYDARLHNGTVGMEDQAMKFPTTFQLACLGIGLLLGGTSRLAVSASKTAPTPNKNPNVVILRGERMITLEQDDLTLPKMATQLGRQTGLTFTLDKAFKKDETPYHFLLSKVSLTRALSAVGYLAHGKWERTRTGYHMRPMTEAERTSDIAMYESAIQRATDYLAAIDPNDPSLSKDEHGRIQSWLDGAKMLQTDLAPLPLDTMGDWKVTSSDHQLKITYSQRSESEQGISGRFRTDSWWWK